MRLMGKFTYKFVITLLLVFIGFAFTQVYAEQVCRSVVSCRPLAEKGDKEAQYFMGMYFLTGRGTKQDYILAKEWLEKSANAGYAKAQYHLGLLYVMGLGVSKNQKEALYWFTLAAKQNYPAAQYNLGVIYSRGLGVAVNQQTAVEWYMKAAKSGDPDAQHNLARKYYIGEGVNRNLVEAYAWLSTALANDLTNQDISKRIKEMIWKEMTPDMRDQALEQAHQYQQKYLKVKK